MSDSVSQPAVDKVLASRDAWVKNTLAVEVPPRPTVGVGDPLVIKAARDLEQRALAIARDVKTEVPRAVKPIALKERIAFCTSELNELDKGIAQLDGRKLGELARKPRLVDTASGLRLALEAAKTEGIKRGQDALSELNKAFTARVDAFATALGRTDANPKELYKPISALLDEVSHARTDWAAQVKEAGAYLGPRAVLLEAGVSRLGELETALNEMVGRCLPKLVSKPGVKPADAGGGGGGGDDVVEPGTEDAILDSLQDWSAAKAIYGTNPKEMQKLADHRKKVVDKWLNDTLGPWGMSAGPGKGWVSVGSDDPTSDYDISINKHGRKETGEVLYDYQIVKMFNDHFRATYGVESGSIFDTNLYASAPAEIPKVANPPSEAEQEALDEIDASNDIGALMKMRRYMSSADFEDYRVRTLESVKGNPKQYKALDKQFKAADANYMISLLDIVEKMRALLATPPDEDKLTKEQVEERKHAKHLIDEWTENAQSVTGLGLATAEEALEELARKLEHAKDANTMATNDLYTEATDKTRQQEAKANEFNANLPQIKQLLAAAASKADTDFPALAEQLRKLGVQDKAADLIAKGDVAAATPLVDGQLATMLSDLARQQALTMFYANEAYQSGGPFKHVVWAGQAVETDVKAEVNKDNPVAWDALPPAEKKRLVDEKRAERRAALTQEESLQSFNEQLGDFLKDLAHYGDKEPGKAIIQSSKYLERLVDAIRLMTDKHMFDADPGLQGRLQRELDLQSRLTNELIAARKGKVWMVPNEGEGPVDQDEQRKAFACDFMKQLGINSVAALGKTYVDLGIQVNAVARKAMAG